MGGLGNGRRGGRSPPLMIAALIACILVLGFNYWVSSSRNLELQTKLYELEGQVRRGAAERELKKSEFQEVQKQKDEIQKEKEQIESFYKRQMDEAQVTCSQEKAKLQQNVSSSTKTIQDLKGHLNQLNSNLGKLQKELQSCQGNINSLNNKLLTQCESKIETEKELCDKKLAAAKLEVQEKIEKLSPLPYTSSQQKNTGKEAVKEEATVKSVPSGTQTAIENHTPSSHQPKGNKNPDSLTNDIIIDQDAEAFGQSPTKDLSRAEIQSVSLAASLKQNKLEPGEDDVRTDEAETKTNKDVKKNLTEIKGVEVMDAHGEGAETKEADPGMEGMLIDQGNPNETPVDQKLEDQEYDADEQVVGGVDVEKEQRDKDMEEELADYNGDDENEGESEADKQEALAQIDRVD